MRADICRIYIQSLLNKINEFESQHDTILTLQIICDLVFDSDVLFDQYGNHDPEFNLFFEQKLQQLYKKYPDQLDDQMKKFNEFKRDMDEFSFTASSESDSNDPLY